MNIAATLRFSWAARTALGAVLAASLPLASAQQDTYPSKPLEIIVPWGPGGGSDITGAIIARAVAAEVYENWTDVSGFLMTDPRIVKDPRPMRKVT